MNWDKKLEKRDVYSLIIFLTQAVLLLGVCCNYLVVSSNQGLMPFYSKNISPGYVVENNWVSFNDSQEVKYSYLGDIIKIGDSLWSIGDILMEIGLTLEIVFMFLWVREITH